MKQQFKNHPLKDYRIFPYIFESNKQSTKK